MPTFPPSNPQIWDPVFSILNSARFRLHQRMPSLVAYSGSILKETQASTQQGFNNGWRKMQAVMAKAGSSTFERSIIIPNIPKINSGALDPSTECSISWFGCSDGLNQFATPALPSDLMTPMWMSERWAGSGLPFPSYREPNMPFLSDGLPKFRKTNWNGCAQWRGEAIYYPGSTQTMDFWIYYQGYFADFADVGAIPWFQQGVPITRCEDALSHWVCREFCVSLAMDETLDADTRRQLMAAAPYFETQAIAATGLLVSPDKKRRQRMNYTRLPFASGGGGGGRVTGGGLPAFTG